MTMYGARCSACGCEGCAIDEPYDDWRCRPCRVRSRRVTRAWVLLGLVLGLLLPCLTIVGVLLWGALR